MLRFLVSSALSSDSCVLLISMALKQYLIFIMHELSRKLAEFSRAFSEFTWIDSWMMARFTRHIFTLLYFIAFDSIHLRARWPFGISPTSRKKVLRFARAQRDSKMISWPLDTLPFNLTWRTALFRKSFKRANRGWGKSDSSPFDGRLDEGYFAIRGRDSTWTHHERKLGEPVRQYHISGWLASQANVDVDTWGMQESADGA